MIVADASALLELILRTGRAERVGARTLAVVETLHAPHLVDVEVLQTLRRLLRQGQIDLESAEHALEDFCDLLIERHTHADLLPRIWQLRESVSAYDASYIALAEALDAPLITCDAKLARSHGHSADIELIE